MRRLLVLVAALWCAAGVAYAVTINSAVTVQTPKLLKAQILNATGVMSIATNGGAITNGVTLYTCPAGGAKIIGLFASSNDTQADVIQILDAVSGATYILTTVSVPITAGFVAATPPVNFMNTVNFPGLPVDSDGNLFMYCQSGDVIVVGVLTTAVTSGKVVTVLMVAAEF